jgi:hypothetical protein
MRSCLVEVGDIGIEHSLQLLLLQDEQVVQAFFSDAPQEPFTHGIRSWGMNRRFKQLDAAGFRHPNKARPKFAIVISNQILGRLPIGVASRRCCATQESVGERVTPTWITLRLFNSIIKKAKRGRKNRSVTCKKSHAQT